ncbi:hypothetical protein [Pseudomonas sp. LP_4_YM]|uniref:hypothetical protein n=1 Tax=Pseudomonas fulva TaxID=47880 RepID=UPI001047FD3D
MIALCCLERIWDGEEMFAVEQQILVEIGHWREVQHPVVQLCLEDLVHERKGRYALPIGVSSDQAQLVGILERGAMDGDQGVVLDQQTHDLPAGYLP